LGQLAGLTVPYRRALTLEIGMQNAGLGTVLATTLYGDQTIATIPTAAYTFGCMLTGTVLALLWRRSRVPSVLDAT
jgi:BASS family bile acid:Na+ symporter